MSPVTPETLARHELVGLRARVSGAENPDLLDVGGTVVAETSETLGIETGAGGADTTGSARTETGRGAARVAQVPKDGTTFEFELPGDGEAGDASDGRTEFVTVEGRRLVARPARRTEHTGDSTWR